MSAVAMALWPQQMHETKEEGRGHLSAAGILDGADVQPLDLCAMARGAVALLSTTGHVEASEVELELPEAPVLARLSRRRMEQVLLHLLADAVVTRRGAPPGRAVRLRVEPQDDFGDYGPTIQLRYAAGTAGAPEPRDVAGTAPVGLTVARALVEAQGGHVAVRRQGMTGSQVTVVVELPDPGIASW